MNTLFNQRGSSLVQVMVISGMVSVFGLAVMQTSKNMQSIKQTMMVKDSIEQFKETASNLLMNEAACSNTLQALVPTRSLAGSDKSPTVIRDYNNDPAYELYSDASAATTVYNGNIRIGSMRFTGFDDTTDSAVLKVTMLKSKTDGVGEKFGQLVLGGKEITIDIPLRVYFSRPAGVVTDCASDPFEACFADSSATEVAQGPLEQLCDDDLGGSFYNGKCIVTEHIMDQTRCDGSYGTCSGVPTNADSFNSMCHNLGGVFDPVTKACKPRFGGVKCPPGTKLKGFDDEGKLRCEVP